MVTNGHLPYPDGRELTGYEVADLSETLDKAKAAEDCPGARSALYGGWTHRRGRGVSGRVRRGNSRTRKKLDPGGSLRDRLRDEASRSRERIFNPRDRAQRKLRGGAQQAVVPMLELARISAGPVTLHAVAFAIAPYRRPALRSAHGPRCGLRPPRRSQSRLRRRALAVDGKLSVRHLDPDAPSGAQRERSSLSAFERRRIEIDVLMDGEGAVAAVARPDETQLAALLLLAEGLLLVARRRPCRSGMIQICRKRTGSVRLALYSLWRTPVPADMRCTSPGRITECSPVLSLCSRAPSSG